MENIGFIGMGNMGQAILKSALKVFSASNLGFSCRKKEGDLKESFAAAGVAVYSSNAECAEAVKYIVLAVKPQVYDTVLNDIKPYLTAEKIIISLAPSVSISELEGNLSETGVRIVRAMPNTPAMIGKAMTGVAYDESVYTEEEEAFLDKFFSSFGEFEKVDESLMSAVVCASGSSPAYAYIFIEALADSVVKYGLSRDLAYKCAAQSLLGAAEMVLTTGGLPASLKDKVCSPGGTTIRAVEKLEENGFRNAVFKATEACFNKCEGKD